MSLITASRENSNNSLIPSISSPTDQNQQLTTTNNRTQSIKVNDRNSMVVPKLTDNGESLIEEIKNLAIALKQIGSNNKKLHTIKGYEELIGRIEEVIVELDEQFKNIISAIKIAPNRIVSEVWKLRLCMYDIQEFFDAVDKSWLFLSKSKMKLRMQNHYQSLRARCTQLFTAISLELLTDKPVEEPPRMMTSSTELYRIGLQYYYGLSGKPKNYIFAFEKFIQAAEYGDVEAMIQTGKCYLVGHGIDKNEDFGIKWLEKAIESSASVQECAHAKTEIALFIVEKLKEKSAYLVKEFFHGKYQQPIDLQDEKRKKKNPSPDRKKANQGQNQAQGEEKADYDDEEDDDEGNDDALEQSLLSVSHILDTERSYLDDDYSQQGKEDEDEGTTTGNSYTHSPPRRSNASATSSPSPNRRFHHAHDLGQDLQTAMKLLVTAAKDGHIEAKTHLGMLYEEGDEFEQAAKWYSLASNGGSSLATCKLGSLLILGKSQYFGNKQKAYSLFMMASKHEQKEAFNGLGLCYEYGIGVDIHLPMAIDYYRQASRLGFPRGMFNCGYLLVKMAIDVMDTRKTTHEKVKRMKDQGYQHQVVTTTTTTTSATDASVLYNNDLNRMTQDEDEFYEEIDSKTLQALEEGIGWLRAAAENQIGEASYQLGRLYEQAIGVPKDPQSALSHYIHAAKHGHARSALLAANLLYKQQESIGIYSYPKTKQISKLYHQAALAGLPDAMNSFGLLLEDGRASPHGTKDLYLAAAWYFQACLADFVPAFLNLAMLLATDQLYSFQSIEGDLITLDEARLYLAKHVPILQLSDEKMDIYQHLLSDISNKAASAVPVVMAGTTTNERTTHVTNEADPNHPLWLRAPISNQQLQYPPGSLREDLPLTVKPGIGTGWGNNNSDPGAIHSLVLMDPNNNHNHRNHPHLNNQNKLSTITNKYTQSPSSNHHHHSNKHHSHHQQQHHQQQHHQQQQQYQSQSDKLLSRHVSFPTTVQPQSYNHHQHNNNNNNNNNNNKPPSNYYQSRPLPTLPTALVYPPPTTSGSSRSAVSYYDSDTNAATASTPVGTDDLVYKSGDYYLTNGEIPPPNYVPRSMMHMMPTLATKPDHPIKTNNRNNNNNSNNNSGLSISIPTPYQQEGSIDFGPSTAISSIVQGPPSTTHSHQHHPNMGNNTVKGNTVEASRPPRLPSPQPTPHVHPNHIGNHATTNNSHSNHNSNNNSSVNSNSTNNNTAGIAMNMRSPPPPPSLSTPQHHLQQQQQFPGSANEEKPSNISEEPQQQSAARRTSFGAKMWGKLVGNNVNTNSGNSVGKLASNESKPATATNITSAASPYPVQTAHGMSLSVPDLK